MKINSSFRKMLILCVSLSCMLLACTEKNTVTCLWDSSFSGNTLPNSNTTSKPSTSHSIRSIEPVSITEGSQVTGDDEILTCGHHHEISVKTPATCTMSGYTTHICLECGTRDKNEIVDALGHDYTYTYMISSNGRYETRTMCTLCGDTLKDNVYYTKTSNKVAYLTSENVDSSVGVVVKDGTNIKAYPSLGFTFDKWSTGETNSSIRENTNAIAIFKFVQTELPIVSIDLANGVRLTDVKRDLYREATITSVNGNTTTTYEATFKGRGNGSWDHTGGKSGYTFKLNSKANFLGMSAKAKKWNLIACKDDPSMHINSAAYGLARDFLPGIEWQTETKFVQFYVNKEYRGVYMLTDPVKVEKTRLNVVSEDDNGNYAYDDENAGFLVEYDRYSRSNSSDFPNDPSGDVEPIENMSYFSVNGLYRDFSVKYPDVDDAAVYGGSISDEKHRTAVLRMKSVLNNFSNVLSNGTYEQLCEVVDIESFMDMYLLHELFKNSDVGWSSFFVYKKPNNSKLFFGPAWDFDLAATKARDSATSGKHISTKTKTGNPNSAECAGYNDMFVKAIKLKDSNGQTRLATELNNRFASLKENILKGIIKLTNGNDNHYFAFAMNKKKWSTQSFDTSIANLMNWLIDRTKWMLANNFVN